MTQAQRDRQRGRPEIEPLPPVRPLGPFTSLSGHYRMPHNAGLSLDRLMRLCARQTDTLVAESLGLSGGMVYAQRLPVDKMMARRAA